MRAVTLGEPPRFDPAAVRAVVFDLDGTLVDSYGPIAASLNHARAAFRMPPLGTLEVRRRVGHGLESLIAEVLGPERVEEGVRLFREHYSEVFARGTRALPGVPDTLRRLRDAGYPMAVASNKPARFSRPILRETRLLPFIDCVLGPDSVGTTKPEPTMIRRCCERLGVTPAHAVYVGDMVLDVESARRAEVAVLLVAGGSSTRTELLATGQLLLDDFAALSAYLPARAAPPS